jgi:hypothetical protein
MPVPTLWAIHVTLIEESISGSASGSGRGWLTRHTEVDGLPESAFPHPAKLTSSRPLDVKWALLPLGRHGGANRSSLRKEGFSAPMLQARARAPAVQRYGD